MGVVTVAGQLRVQEDARDFGVYGGRQKQSHNSQKYSGHHDFLRLMNSER